MLVTTEKMIQHRHKVAVTANQRLLLLVVVVLPVASLATYCTATIDWLGHTSKALFVFTA